MDAVTDQYVITILNELELAMHVERDVRSYQLLNYTLVGVQQCIEKAECYKIPEFLQDMKRLCPHLKTLTQLAELK